MYENQRLLRFSSTLGWKMWNVQNMKMKRLLVKNDEKIEEMNVGHAGSDWKWFLWNQKFLNENFFLKLEWSFSGTTKGSFQHPGTSEVPYADIQEHRKWHTDIQEHRKCHIPTSRNIGSDIPTSRNIGSAIYWHPGTSEVPYTDIQKHRKCHKLTSRNTGSAICWHPGTPEVPYAHI